MHNYNRDIEDICSQDTAGRDLDIQQDIPRNDLDNRQQDIDRKSLDNRDTSCNQSDNTSRNRRILHKDLYLHNVLDRLEGIEILSTKDTGMVQLNIKSDRLCVRAKLDEALNHCIKKELNHQLSE